MPYPEAAWERAMTVQEVMLKAISGEWHWYRAAEVLGWSPLSYFQRHSGLVGASSRHGDGSSSHHGTASTGS